MLRVLLCALMFVGLSVATPAFPPPTPEQGAEFIQTAIYEGLTEDGVAPSLAAKLIQNPDFVSGCRICESTKKAFTKYANLTQAPPAAKGRGLTEEFTKKLNSNDAELRRAAMRDLIQRYTDRGFERANFTADEKKAMDAMIKTMVFKLKDPEAGLPDGLKFCPSCDGTCRVKAKSNP